MEIRRDVFQAIADPNRRAIIELVANHKLTLNGVADHFDISRPAISKHIKILTECGLITIHQLGRERYCEAKFEKLSEVARWVEDYKRFWESKLDALENYLETLQSNKKLKTKKNKKAKKRTDNQKNERYGSNKKKYGSSQ